MCSSPFLSARIRSQRKRELEMEVAQLKKQVKQKRKAALNSSGIGEVDVGVSVLRGCEATVRVRVHYLGLDRV